MYALICTYICCYSYRSTCFSILFSPLLFLYYFSEVSALYSHCFGFCAARSYSNCFIFVLFFLFRISHGFGILVRRETIANHIDTGVYKLKWIIIIRNTRENIKQTTLRTEIQWNQNSYAYRWSNWNFMYLRSHCSWYADGRMDESKILE